MHWHWREHGGLHCTVCVLGTILIALVEAWWLALCSHDSSLTVYWEPYLLHWWEHGGLHTLLVVPCSLNPKVHFGIRELPSLMEIFRLMEDGIPPGASGWELAHHQAIKPFPRSREISSYHPSHQRRTCGWRAVGVFGCITKWQLHCPSSPLPHWHELTCP